MNFYLTETIMSVKIAQFMEKFKIVETDHCNLF